MSLGFVRVFTFLSSLLVTASLAAESLSLQPLADASALAPAPLKIGGRVVPTRNSDGAAAYRLQWPGVYFETAFSGKRAAIQVGEGNAIYQVRVDGAPALTLVKPAPGLYAVEGLADGAHTVRVTVVSENQANAVNFGGILVAAEAAPRATPALARRIEFIGDSHTVGYANTSTTRESAGDTVWLTTDNSQAFGPLVAAHFGAEYQVNAISGRGIVRNYNGGGGATLPQAHPFALFDGKTPVRETDWQPHVVVIGLATNDFSTPLNPGEKWKTRDELHADYEATYVAFVRELRARYPRAFFVLAANDMAEGEIQREVKKVAERLIASGEQRVAFVVYPAMELTAADWHPSLDDHQLMARTLIALLESRPDVWAER